jgi:uncharacterized membrane protein
MLSIILNIITILIVITMIVLFLKLYYNVKSKTVDKEVTASQVAQDIIKDPLVVSRAYFTEPKYGKIGTFKGQQTPSDYDWISGKLIPDEE